MMKTVPPLNDLFNMAGLNLPTYLTKTNETPQEIPTEDILSAEEKG
jgi:band 7 protein